MFNHFNLKSTVKNALLRGGRVESLAVAAGVCIGLGAAPAAAQQTPQTYCASLPAVSCEILNLELGGMAVSAYLYGVALIKYCRNQQLLFVPIDVSGGSWGQPSPATFNFEGMDSTGQTATAGSSQGTHPTAFSNTLLCAKLP